MGRLLSCYLIHSSVEGHLDCFCFLAIVNHPAMNIGVRIFVWTNVFIVVGIYLEVELSVYSITLFLLFENVPDCFPQLLHRFALPPAEYEGSDFSTFSPTLVIGLSFGW